MFTVERFDPFVIFFVGFFYLFQKMKKLRKNKSKTFSKQESS